MLGTTASGLSTDLNGPLRFTDLDAVAVGESLTGPDLTVVDDRTVHTTLVLNGYLVHRHDDLGVRS